MSKEGQNVRKAYQRRLPSNTAKDYYFMQRDTGNTQSITVEYGFLDSLGDDVSQLKSNWKNYAEAVVRAITQYLNIPYTLTGEETYTVKSGDSLWSIAKKFNVSVSELKQANNLTSNSLSIGQILNIPKEEVIESNTYIVKSGDSLYSIARNNNTTVDDLKRLNNLTSNSLSIGQILKMPKEEVIESNTYIVKSGDSLYSIARNNNTTVDDLKRLNNLTSNSLSIGQILKIPKEAVIESNTYIVKSGDSLYSIARNNNTTVDDLKRLNNLTSNTLSIGQVLKLK